MPVFKKKRKKNSGDIAFVVLTDIHSGYRGGLLLPDTLVYDELEDGTEVERELGLTPIQEYLAELNSENIHRFTEWIGDLDVYLLFLGDPTHGVKYVSEVSEPSIYNQVLIAVHSISSWLELDCVVGARLASGTDSHEFENGAATKLVTKLLKGAFPKKDIALVTHGLLNANGAVVDYAHHGPGKGIRVWTYGNVARLTTQSLMIRELLNKNTPPDLYLRGHFHSLVSEVATVYTNNKVYQSRIVVAPSMCWMTNYAKKVTRSEFEITNGVVGFKVIDGELTMPKFFTNTVDMRTKERI